MQAYLPGSLPEMLAGLYLAIRRRSVRVLRVGRRPPTEEEYPCTECAARDADLLADRSHRRCSR